MDSQSGQHEAFWIATTEGTDYPPLEGEVEVDVAVLGGGIAGVTAALLLKEAGATVAVVDTSRILSGVTGHTTAKLTVGHGLVYDTLISKLGEERARMYAESNQAAVEHVVRTAAERGIDCDLEERPNYVYAESQQDVESVEREVAAAQRLDLPATFTTETGLPFLVAGAIRYDRQRQFHPRKYLLALARAIPGDGSHVLERTRAVSVDEGEPCVVECDRGRVRARHVLVTTHVPFLDRGLFFAKVHPYRAYVVAAPIPEERDPQGMYITTSSPSRSVRSHPYEDGRILLYSGNGHRTGDEPDPRRRYRELEDEARERFGVDEISFRWSTQDYYSVDKVPYVGRLTRRSDQVHVATGFGGWGMSNGTLSGLLLADAVLGRDNPWAALYDAKRLVPKASAAMFVKENAAVARHWVGDRVRHPERTELDRLGRGEGGIVRVRGERLGVYRDEDGTLHAVRPVCTHLACLVRWNGAERSWDCPCHGSRFDVDGRVLQGPAVHDLERRDVE